MRSAGRLDDPHRYFGLNAHRGARWYNFTPTAYLECGAAGSLGGWEPEDPTGRELVPGPVAAMSADGEWISVDAATVERPIHSAESLPWETVGTFLWCGQSYE